MLKIIEMSQEEMQLLLQRSEFGHLGCTRDGHPYVVPMHYVFDSDDLFILTTDGTKTEFIAGNSEVCFQVEAIVDANNWKSVMVVGRAYRLANSHESERVIRLMQERNLSKSPAFFETEIGNWRRQNNLVAYRIRPDAIYGRRTAAMKLGGPGRGNGSAF